MTSMAERDTPVSYEIKTLMGFEMDSVKAKAKAQHKAAYEENYSQLGLPMTMENYGWRLDNYFADRELENYWRMWNRLHSTVALAMLGYGDSLLQSARFFGHNDTATFNDRPPLSSYNSDPKITQKIDEIHNQVDKETFFDYGVIIDNSYFGGCRVFSPRTETT